MIALAGFNASIGVVMGTFFLSFFSYPGYGDGVEGRFIWGWGSMILTSVAEDSGHRSVRSVILIGGFASLDNSGTTNDGFRPAVARFVGQGHGFPVKVGRACQAAKVDGSGMVTVMTSLVGLSVVMKMAMLFRSLISKIASWCCIGRR
ncbi:hypothetical protein ACLB2K_022725 [Fragaria x ananassa]